MPLVPHKRRLEGLKELATLLEGLKEVDNICNSDQTILTRLDSGEKIIKLVR